MSIVQVRDICNFSDTPDIYTLSPGCLVMQYVTFYTHKIIIDSTQIHIEVTQKILLNGPGYILRICLII